MRSFREQLNVMKTYYKKELFLWFVGTFLFLGSVLFLAYESINLFKVTRLRERVLEYTVRTMKTLTSSKELFKLIGKENAFSQIKEVKISGQVELKDLGQAISFFESLNSPKKGKFFILEQATKDKSLLKFSGEKVYLR